MDGCFGFRVQVQAKTLTTGGCRLKPTTIATVIGNHYASAASGGGPVNLTLTDKSDSSEWQAQLAWDGVKHYVFNGLKPWLAHCNAKAGESMEVFREANGPRLYVRLVAREASAAASAPAGQDPSQQRPAWLHDNKRCASEGETAAVRPPKRHTHITAAPGPALHTAGPQALPPSLAAAAPPAEGMEDAQAGPSLSEPRSCGTAALGHAFGGCSPGLSISAASAPPDPSTGSSVAASYPNEPAQPPTATNAGRPSALPAAGAAVAASEQPVPVRGNVRAPWCNSGCGGSGGAPPAADLQRAHSHPYGGAWVDAPTAQPPLVANQQGPSTDVARVQGMAELGNDQLASTGMAEGTAEDVMATGSGACGSVAAAEAPVRGAHDAPVDAAGADLPGASPHTFRPKHAQASSPLAPPTEDVRCPQPGNGRGVSGPEDPGGGLRSRGVEGGASGGGQPPAARGIADGCSGGGPLKAAELAAPDAQSGDASAGVAMRAVLRGSQICLRRPVAVALWPGLADQMQAHQPHEVLLHTTGTPAAAKRGRQKSGGHQQGAELLVYPMKLVLYDTSDFRLTGVKQALRSLGVNLGNKEDVGLRRLPCGRVLLERWRQQGQGQGTRPNTNRSGAQGGGMPWGEHEGDSDEEYVPPPKRRRLQGRASGGSGTAATPRIANPGPVASNVNTNPSPVQLHAPATAAQAWAVRIEGSSLLPPAAATWQLWPQQAAALKVNMYPGHSVPVTLLTAACNHTPAEAQARAMGIEGGEQVPAEQHTVLLHYTPMSKKFRVKDAAGVVAALGLRGGDDTMRLRMSTDGRAWAERATPSAGQQQSDPAFVDPPAACAGEWILPLAVNSAQQQLAPALAPPVAAVPNPTTTALALQQPRAHFAAASTGPAAAAPATDANSPLTSPALSPDATHLLLYSPAAPPTTTATAPLCVSGGYLHLARPTVATLWPECLDMPVGTQQLVRMRAVVEPGGGGNTAAATAAAAGSNAGPIRSVTHYGNQLARLGGGAWRLEHMQALLREIRLGEGDWVQLVPLAGGVVGVHRAGPEAKAGAG